MASKKEKAKEIIKYCLSTFDNAETPGTPDETSKTTCLFFPLVDSNHIEFVLLVIN